MTEERVIREIGALSLSPYKDNLKGLVVESTFNWYWLVDALMDEGFKLYLANPAAIQQYSGLKHADDHSDARWLAEMLRLNILPEGYIYPRELRAVRDLMRKRMDIVQQSTKNLLSVQSCYMRHLGYKLSSNKWPLSEKASMLSKYTPISAQRIQRCRSFLTSH
ncbi:IS110 family transposase [Pseudoalteromonas sp. ZZD1]